MRVEIDLGSFLLNWKTNHSQDGTALAKETQTPGHLVGLTRWATADRSVPIFQLSKVSTLSSLRYSEF